jgi:signal transduction histidine kinase
MKYRLRFVFIHTLVVSGILFCAMLSIYFLYSDARQNTFRQRLDAQAYQSFISFYHVDTISEKLFDNAAVASGHLNNLGVIIFNDSEQLVYANPPNLKKAIQPKFLEQIKSEKKLYFLDSNNECVGTYIKSRESRAYVIISAYDRLGLVRLNELRWIMIIVSLIAIICAGLFSFFYVIYVTKPLVKLSLQMRHLNESNLNEKFDAGNKGPKDNELTQIAANFNAMRERLIKSFDMQKSFVHHASHELRTPLAVMLSQTESALRKDLTPAEAKAVLQSLKEDQQEMIELTNSLLLLSQYEQSDFSRDWQLIRLDEVLYDTIEMIKRMFKNINISIEFEEVPDDELKLSIKGNEILLRSAFRNLIKNAYQYSEDKTVVIIISCNDNAIDIHFNNKGKLVSESERPQLFVPFFRSITFQHKKGFGLGLSIVRRIVSLHKGTVAYSPFGEETNRFTISFKREL